MRKPTPREGLLTVLFAVTLAFTLYRPPPKFEVSEAMAQVTCAALPYVFVSGTVASATQLNADFNAVVSCIQSVRSSPYVNTLVDLKAASTLSYTTGVWRLTYNTSSTAPPLFYIPSGTACSLNSGDGDNGWQVKSSNSKCWIAVFPTSGIDARQFGLLSAGDNTTILQAASDATFNSSLPTKKLIVPISTNFTTFAIYGNMTLECGGYGLPLTRTSSGIGLYTTDQPGHAYAQGVVANVTIRDCHVASAPSTLSGNGIHLEAVDGYLLENVSATGAGVSGAALTSASTGALFTGTGAGTTLTVTNVSGVIHPGSIDSAALFGTGVPASTYIVSQSTGPAGGAGDYITSVATTSSGDALSTTSNLLDITGITRGALAVGQEILCDSCGIATLNTYPIISQVNSNSLVTFTGGLNSTISARPMVTVSTHSYTNADGTRTYADANLVCLGGFWGCFNGEIRHGYYGYDWRTSLPAACGDSTNASTSTIGMYFESSQALGGSKYNQNRVTDVQVGCNYIGVFVANGADNYFNGMDGQFDVWVIANGFGDSNSQNNDYHRPYCEGYSNADPTSVCVNMSSTTASLGSQVHGSGSFSQVAYPMNTAATHGVVWNIENYGNYRTGQQEIWFWEPLPSSLPSNPLSKLPVPILGGNQGMSLIGAQDENIEMGVQAFGASALAYNHCGRGRGSSIVPALVQTGDILCRFDGWGQYDTTQGHLKEGAAIDIIAGSNFSSTNAESYIQVSTVPNASTTLTSRWQFKADGSFVANGLTAHGAGFVNAIGYYVNDTAGVDCTIVGATAHLTVVKGLVTLCN